MLDNTSDCQKCGHNRNCPFCDWRNLGNERSNWEAALVCQWCEFSKCPGECCCRRRRNDLRDRRRSICREVGWTKRRQQNEYSLERHSAISIRNACTTRWPLGDTERVRRGMHQRKRWKTSVSRTFTQQQPSRSKSRGTRWIWWRKIWWRWYG